MPPEGAGSLLGGTPSRLILRELGFRKPKMEDLCPTFLVKSAATAALFTGSASTVLVSRWPITTGVIPRRRCRSVQCEARHWAGKGAVGSAPHGVR
uniref:Uncharacterized protein n=1 Tax=viral metagenome TaxID=1070528 RepID=A0A2V0RA29_9ZZZZ